MDNETRSFTWKGTTYHISVKRRNKHREWWKRILRILTSAGKDSESASNFAAISTYTVQIEGEGWKPPSPHALEKDLIEAYDYWWEEIDSELTDQFILSIYLPPDDPATSPLPLSENADPNL